MEASDRTNEFNPNDIPRCDSCNLIPLFNIDYEDESPIISYECQNNHKNKLKLIDYMKKSKKNSIFKINCNECNSDNKVNSFFCSKCNKFICKECCIKHSDTNKHIIMNNDKFDSICIIHSNTFSSYCLNCKANLCVYCIKEHKEHKIIFLENIIMTENEINEFMNKINKIKNITNKIEDIKNNIIKELDKFKEINNLEIQFISELLGTFEYENKKNNINYNVIQNLKNYEKKYNKQKYNILEEVFNESENYINFLKKEKSYKKVLNSIKYKKTIKSHSQLIYHISFLQDGRFASCSNDKNLIIYDSINFEPQIQISNLHSDQIFSFTQLQDGKIITCSADKTMKVIELGDKKYYLKQSLEDHSGFVVKTIEFNKNELVSISNDNLIKFWIMNKDKFICVKSVKFQNNQNYAIGILKINKTEFVSVDNGDNKLKFWNYYNYSMIKEFKESISSNWNSVQLCLLNEKNFIFADNDLYIFNIESKELIKKINSKGSYSVIKCLDGTFLCNERDNNNQKLVKYKINKNNEIEKIDELNNISSGYIYALAEFNDGTIIFGDDNLIKIWG